MGTGATFFVKWVDADIMLKRNCADCHGAAPPPRSYVVMNSDDDEYGNADHQDSIDPVALFSKVPAPQAWIVPVYEDEESGQAALSKAPASSFDPSYAYKRKVTARVIVDPSEAAPSYPFLKVRKKAPYGTTNWTSQVFSAVSLSPNTDHVLLPEAEDQYVIIERLIPVELNIFSGQDAAYVVPDGKEETVGAFTVANLNDTDGDGTVDKDDNVVKAAAGATGVSDEVDLMKLEIKGPTTGRMKVTVVGGAVKFWEMKTKETAIPLASNAFFVNAADLPKTVWIEATAVSTSVRDIHLKLGYEPPGGGVLVDDIDRVKATAVWVTKTGFIHQNGQTIPADFDAPISQPWKANPPLLLPGPFFTQAGPRHGMIMEFKLAPTGIDQEALVKFDIARKVESRTFKWVQNGAQYQAQLLGSKTATPFDLANDDNSTTDEDVDPTNLHIYDTDVPSLNIPPGALQPLSSELIQDMANFNEWVRVRFDGQRPDNTTIGSRCSPQEKWHNQSKSGFTMKQNQRIWAFDPNFTNEVNVNHIQLPTNP